MVSQAIARSKYLLSPAPVSNYRVLIVTDCSDRLRGWKASMHTDGIEITSAGTSEELSRACHHEHDLAVIDVGVASLPEVLRALRSSVRHSGIPLLVEASRVLAEPSLTGVLPKHRAMPCSRSDLLKLARRLIAGADVHPRRKGMLL